MLRIYNYSDDSIIWHMLVPMGLKKGELKYRNYCILYSSGGEGE